MHEVLPNPVGFRNGTFEKCGSPKGLISLLEEEFRKAGRTLPKRDRLHSDFLKDLKEFLQKDFSRVFPEFFTSLESKDRVVRFEDLLTEYIQKFFGEKLDSQANQSIYKGKWEGMQFVFGSLISKDTMKQMITSSREKAYFYGLQKCLKSSSQKKLAVLLKNQHLVELIKFLFKSKKVEEVLSFTQ